MDILDLLTNNDPMAAQRRQAALLSGKQQFQQTATSANDQANSLNLLNFVAQNSNNSPLATAVGGLQKSQQAQYTPQKLDKGIYVPATGDYEESPGVADEKQTDREEKRLQTLAAYQARQDSIEARAAADADRTAQRRDAAASRDAVLAIGRESAAANRSNMNQMRELRLSQQQDQFTAKQVQDLSNKLEKAGVPEFESALQTGEANLTKYKTGELPGYGRLLSYIPNMALDNEGQGVRADMAQAANVLLKARSGSAVTDSEQRRFLQEVGSGGGMSEDTMRRGWANIRRTFEAKKSGILAAVPDEALGAYNERAAIPLNRRSTDKKQQPDIAHPGLADDDAALVNKYLK